MKNNRIFANNLNNGFSLVEMMITVLISGILFFFIGQLMLTTQSSYMKASNKTAAGSDFNFVKTHMEYVIRGSTGTISVATGILTVRRISDNALIQFSFNPTSRQIIYKVTIGGSTVDQVIMSNVTIFSIVASGAGSKNLRITIQQQDKNGTLNTSAFTIVCRNLD